MEEKTEKKTNGNKPIYRFQCGNVSASVFCNEVEKDGVTYPRYNVNIERSYKIGDEWKRTSSFGVNDLHKVITVAQKAFEVINMNQEGSDGQSPSPASDQSREATNYAHAS